MAELRKRALLRLAGAQRPRTADHVRLLTQVAQRTTELTFPE
jgi:hypothetical protein